MRNHMTSSQNKTQEARKTLSLQRIEIGIEKAKEAKIYVKKN